MCGLVVTIVINNDIRYYLFLAIKSFKDKATAAAFAEQPVRSHPPDIRKRALAKLQQLHAAMSLEDLRVPPSNRLEALAGDRAGQHSIRINRQWRLCFVFAQDGVEDVEISKHYE
jgi:proteic killer suppression protein